MPVRIYALAKELSLDSKELVDVVKKVGISGKGSALASLDDDEAQRVREHLSGRSEAPAAQQKVQESKPAAPGAVRDAVTPAARKPAAIRVGRSGGAPAKGGQPPRASRPRVAVSDPNREARLRTPRRHRSQPPPRQRPRRPRRRPSRPRQRPSRPRQRPRRPRQRPSPRRQRPSRLRRVTHRGPRQSRKLVRLRRRFAAAKRASRGKANRARASVAARPPGPIGVGSRAGSSSEWAPRAA